MRRLLLLLLFVAACSKGPEADLPYVSQARSLAAEWALVNQQAEQGHLTAAYVRTMRSDLHQQLQSTLVGLPDRNSQLGQEVTGLVTGLLVEPASASPQRLRGYADRLKQIEDSLESA